MNVAKEALSRRDFLRLGGLAAGALALESCISGFSSKETNLSREDILSIDFKKMVEVSDNSPNLAVRNIAALLSNTQEHESFIKYNVPDSAQFVSDGIDYIHSWKPYIENGNYRWSWSILTGQYANNIIFSQDALKSDSFKNIDALAWDIASINPSTFATAFSGLALVNDLNQLHSDKAFNQAFASWFSDNISTDQIPQNDGFSLPATLISRISSGSNISAEKFYNLYTTGNYEAVMGGIYGIKNLKMGKEKKAELLYVFEGCVNRLAMGELDVDEAVKWIYDFNPRYGQPQAHDYQKLIAETHKRLLASA